MKSRSPNPESPPKALYLPITLTGLLVMAALVLTYGSSIREATGRRALLQPEYRGKLWSASIGKAVAPYFREGEAAKPSYSPIHIWIPIVREPSQPANPSIGCESVYGAATWQGGGDIQARYLIKFKYDFRKGVCRSSDLFYVGNQEKQTLTVQLIEVSRDSSGNHEVPLRVGLRLSTPERGQQDWKIEEADVPSRFPYFERIDSPSNPKFSAQVSANQVKWIATPETSIQTEMLERIRHYIGECIHNHHCEPIEGAVGLMSDEPILKELRNAELAGIPVRLITSFNFYDLNRFDHAPELYHPWVWLRGNPFKYVMRYPMHAKFVVFGNESVLSTDGNFEFTHFRLTRSMAFIYQHPEVTSIFREAAFLLRSSFFYPIRIDRRDSFVLLINAARQHRYSAAAGISPRLIFEDEQGVRSSAYGMLMDEIERTPGKLDIFMSPVTDSCWNYRKRLCFFELLKKRSNQDLATLSINAAFYPQIENGRPAKKTAWQTLKDKVLTWTRSPAPTPGSELPDLLDVFDRHPENFRAYSFVGTAGGSHHERIGLLGKDVVLAGSANFASSGVQNTIEILRLPQLNEQLRNYIQSFDEPYLVLPKVALSDSRHILGECEFVYERNVFSALPERAPERVTATDVLNKLRAAGAIQSGGRYGIVVPSGNTYETKILDPKDRGSEIPAMHSYCVKDLASGRVFSWLFTR
jgi:hypothetical protein